jgi:pyruvate/2-oxoglutarate dehydrogenase complex dihydrolipoamide acyltransferase (E2) component
MTATLSADHRTIDEAAIARFLDDPKERPQPPGTRAEAAPGIPV